MSSEAQRLNKPQSRGPAPTPSLPEYSTPGTVSAGPPGPAWAAAPAGLPFGLGGVQRKVAIGESNDVYERQADQVAGHVAGGRQVPHGMITPISGALGAVGQREPKPEEKKKEEKPAAAAPVQKQSRPEDKKKEEKPGTPPVQKQAKPEEKKKDEKPATAPVQKQAKPGDKKKEEKPGTAPPVQKQAKPEEKKKDEKLSAAPVQKQSKPEDKKKEEKTATAPPVQKQAKPEEKKKDEKPTAAPVQKQAKSEEKKKEERPTTAPPVQKQSKPEDRKKDEKPTAAPVQKQAKQEEKKKDEKPAMPPVQRETRPEDKRKSSDTGAEPVQRASSDKDAADRKDEAVETSRGGGGAASAPSMESAAARAISNKGPGEPLNSATRSTLESRMGTDLSDVRVHNDSAAYESASALNARAFTHQNNIWLGHGESQSDTRLMAHEATHVVQQTGSVHRMLVQRAGPPAGAGTPPAPVASVDAAGGDSLYKGPEGEVKNKELIIEQMKVPTFKLPATQAKAPIKLPKKTDDPRPDDQIQTWETEAKKGTGIDSKLEKKLKDGRAPATTKSGQPIFFLKLKGADVHVIGNQTTIKNRSLRPYWDKSGQAETYDVDHIVELQLGGSNTDLANFWLLQSQANRSSGRNIRAEKNDRIQKLIDAAAAKKAWDKPPDLDTARRDYDITVKKFVGGLDVEGSPAKRWTMEEIRDEARQLDELTVLTKKQIEAEGLQGSPSQIVIYTNEAGGGRRVSKGWKDGQTEKKENFTFGKLFKVDLVKYDHSSGQGSIHGVAFRDSKLISEVAMEFPIQEMDAVDYGGFVSKAGVTRTIQKALKLKGLSPIQMDDIELTDKGFVGRGKVMPDIRPLDKLSLDLVIDGDNIYVSKVLSAGDFNFPGPIKVPSASLEVFAGTQGVGAKGIVNIEIEKVGKGSIKGTASTSEGFGIEGEFDFDTDLFDPAKVHVAYTKGKFSGGGKIGIKPGKVRGIKSASIEASFDDAAIDAKGSIIPDIPAVEQADLTMHYDEKAGLTIAGDLQLKKDIPGIEGGSIHAEVNKKGDKYTVKASGEATPKIPGISSKLVVSYDDGAFDASVTAGYEKGMLKGSVTVGATNRPVGDDGKPAGEAPASKAEKITIYGGGSVTLKLAPWLQATAAIKFLPNGEVEVTGKIGLPSVLNIFDEKKVEKNILKVALDIPILGFSVLGHNVGIFLEIGGGLDLSAGIGPGQLQDVELSVTYNPAHEEDTEVHGHAALHIPAHAGLRMFVSAALGAGIPIVDAKAGLELGGSLGVEGALHAAVDVDWSPKKGLVLDANAEIYAEPKFKFDIKGFVLVELDLLFTTKTLYEKDWKLKEVEYGSGLRFGLKLPIHYEEGKPFNVSLSDIQFEKPDIDPMSVIKGLFDKIV